MSPPIPSPISHQARILKISPAQRVERFDAATILARVLEGNDPEIRLSEALRTHPNLEEALQSLPQLQRQRQRLQRNCGSQYDSLLSLAHEENPDRFYEALTEVGSRLESEDRFEMAARIYTTVVALNHGLDIGTERRAAVERARSRLALFSGRGAWGDRFEFWGRRALRDSVDPSLLVGIGAATLAYRGVRLAVLSRMFRPLASAGLAETAVLSAEARATLTFQPNRIYRLRAALLAGAVGMGAEASVFLYTSRLVDELRGRPVDWSEQGFRDEFRLAYLNFAGMHVGGAVFSLLARRTLGIRHLLSGEASSARLLTEASAARRFSHEVAVQLGGFSGLMLAHLAAQSRGIGPEQGRHTDILGDSLRILAQVGVMRALTARPFRASSRSMEAHLSGRGGEVLLPGPPPEPGD